MILLDEKLIADPADGTEAPGELAQEDKEFLSSLEKMAKEVEDDANSID